MADAVARQKYACPACGAEATWNPAKQALVCNHCGTVSPTTLPAAPGGGAIPEHDLVAALRSVPDGQRGWQTERVQVLCQSCKAISVFEPNRVAQRCEFCGSASLVPYEETKEPFRPESLLAFKVSDVQVRETIRQWYGSRWFAPNALGTRALTDQLHGMYVPYWTFDAQVHADWTAESGYYYYETESYTDAQGNRQTRQVQRTRWEYSSGESRPFLRRRTDLRLEGRGPRTDGRSRAVPDEGSRTVRTRLPRRLGCRTLSD